MVEADKIDEDIDTEPEETQTTEPTQDDFQKCIIDNVEPSHDEKKKKKTVTGFEAMKSGDLEKLPDFVKELKDPDTLKLIAMQLHLPEDALVNLAPPLGGFLLKYLPIFIPTNLEGLNVDKYKKYSMLFQDAIPVFKAIFDTTQSVGVKQEVKKGEIESFLSGLEEPIVEKKEESANEIVAEVKPEDVEPETIAAQEEKTSQPRKLANIDDICKKLGWSSEDVLKKDFYAQARAGSRVGSDLMDNEQAKAFESKFSDMASKIKNLKIDEKYVQKPKVVPENVVEIPTLYIPKESNTNETNNEIKEETKIEIENLKTEEPTLFGEHTPKREDVAPKETMIAEQKPKRHRGRPSKPKSDDKSEDELPSLLEDD